MTNCSSPPYCVCLVYVELGHDSESATSYKHPVEQDVAERAQEANEKGDMNMDKLRMGAYNDDGGYMVYIK